MSLLLANLIVTSLMTGIIWMVQLVVYPAFRQVAEDDHSDYHDQHMKHITPLVAPLMILELVLAIVWMMQTYDLMRVLHLACAIILWLSTFIIQVPLHQRLKTRFDLQQINTLVKSNWIRTIVWTLKTIFISYAAYQAYQ